MFQITLSLYSLNKMVFKNLFEAATTKSLTRHTSCTVPSFNRVYYNPNGPQVLHRNPQTCNGDGLGFIPTFLIFRSGDRGLCKSLSLDLRGSSWCGLGLLRSISINRFCVCFQNLVAFNGTAPMPDWSTSGRTLLHLTLPIEYNLEMLHQYLLHKVNTKIICNCVFGLLCSLWFVRCPH